MSTLDAPWPLSPPADQTAGLTAPSRRYLRDARLAVVALALLLLLYFSLTGWLGYVAGSRVVGVVNGWTDTPVLDILVALPAAFLFVVMVKGLFMVRRGTPSGLTPITEEQEPALFAFIHRVADEAGAPRPHRVYLSPQVNASVFYDLSWFNILFPTRKNLVIGLGLVNTLHLDEFKAVLAHEFGHFAQRTMRIGTWVYLTQQFVGELVVRRDGLDRMLDSISRSDIRIAWIGWIMRLWVWSVRSVIDTAFRGVMLLHRSLSREMEFQADRVAVSLTGSDSLIHALHRLSAADLALDRAVHFALSELESDRAPNDLFAIQTRIIEHLRDVLHDPAFGRTPQPPADDRANFRVFASDVAEVPRMWSTHPPNPDREESAKERYLPSRLDGRKAWVLFRDPETLRRTQTEQLLKQIVDRDIDHFAPIDVCLEELRRIFDRPHLAPRYRGAWVERDLTRHSDTCDALWLDEAGSWTDDDIDQQLASLYPEPLRHDLERAEELERELQQLKGLKDGILEAPGGVIRFRGHEVRRRDLPKWIATVTADAEAARETIHAHDRRVRSVHLAAARRLDPTGAWATYLQSLVQLLHYAEHASADLADAWSHLDNAVTMAMADSSINERELRRIQAAAVEVHDANQALHRARRKITLPIALLDEWEVDDWVQVLGEPYELPMPTQAILGEWMQVAEGWTRHGIGVTRRLARGTLDVLCQAEAWIEWSWKAGPRPTDAPAPPPARVPEDYPRRCVGDERPRITKFTWWDKFVRAEGSIAGTARFSVALAVLVPGLWATVDFGGPSVPWFPTEGEVRVHNGFAVALDVQVGEAQVAVAPGQSVVVSPGSGVIDVRAETGDGRLVEAFTIDGPSEGVQAVYNPGQGAAFVRLHPPPVDRFEYLGPVGWHTLDGEQWVEQRDTYPMVSSGIALVPLTGIDPSVIVGVGLEHAEPGALAPQVHAHLRYDPIDSPAFPEWIRSGAHPELAAAVPLDEILVARWRDEPFTALRALRSWMDVAAPAVRDRICAEQARRAEAGEADGAYLDLRCQDAELEDWASVRDRYPDHRFIAYGYAAHLTEHGRVDEAASVLDLDHLPDVPHVAVWRWRLGRLADRPLPEAALIAKAPELAVIGSEHPPPTPPDRPGWRAAFDFAQRGPDAARHDSPYPKLVEAWRAAAGLEHRLTDDDVADLPPDGLWPALGAAVRDQRDVTPIVGTLVPRWSPDVSNIAEALTALREHGDPDRYEADLGPLDLETRGHALQTAAVLLGRDTPAAWVDEVRATLLWPERPHLDAVLERTPVTTSASPTAKP